MPDKKLAIITGISGQDGYYLSRRLIQENFEVIGTTRNLNNICHYQINPNVKLLETNYELHDLIDMLKDLRPNYIFNMAGQSFVAKSWDILAETLFSQGQLVANILEAIEKSGIEVKFINATSSEIFDHSQTQPFKECSPKTPHNPYGCAQLLGYHLVRIYREKRSLWAANAILFPHESIRRPKHFLFHHIIDGLHQILSRQKSILEIGNLSVERDWGFAPEYMQGVYLQSQLSAPDDFIFCTGKKFSVQEVLSVAFENTRLQMEQHIRINNLRVRNYEPMTSYGDPTKAKEVLGWEPKTYCTDLINKLIYEYKQINSSQ